MKSLITLICAFTLSLSAFSQESPLTTSIGTDLYSVAGKGAGGFNSTVSFILEQQINSFLRVDVAAGHRYTSKACREIENIDQITVSGDFFRAGPIFTIGPRFTPQTKVIKQFLFGPEMQYTNYFMSGNASIPYRYGTYKQALMFRNKFFAPGIKIGFSFTSIESHFSFTGALHVFYINPIPHQTHLPYDYQLPGYSTVLRGANMGGTMEVSLKYTMQWKSMVKNFDTAEPE